jgi:hypothetical protein
MPYPFNEGPADPNVGGESFGYGPPPPGAPPAPVLDPVVVNAINAVIATYLAAHPEVENDPAAGLALVLGGQ